ncbi:hypothetical protein BXZ70DRAFT_1080760 [Cristinia sonorae]|uniref:Uncharacterized protein n=1 Tax=Cristinia sonorae TaxID=1940300 RepID=A0A8K0UFF2_9AGAR|nr:hypothetical protein BXZ70DRAFT_1080760 [Cristinia sonorae]
MPRREREGGYIIKTSTYLVCQQGHSPSYQQAPTDSPQLQPKNLKEADRSTHQTFLGQQKRLRGQKNSSNSLRRGYHTVERGGEVSINWMMRKGKVLSRAVKKKYKEKKQDRNSDQGSGQAQRPSLNPGSPRGALSMDYVNLLEFKEQVKKEKLPARQF